MAHGDTGQVLQQSTFQIQARPAISPSRWSLRPQQLFVLRPGTDNGSFITQGTFETRPDKAVAISVKSHPELARKTGPRLSEELQASFGLGGQLPPPWPWLQGLLPGLSLTRAFGGSTPYVPHRAPHCGNISCPPWEEQEIKRKKKKKKLTHFGESAYFQRRSVIANSRAGAGSGAPGDERQELLPTPCSPPGTRTSTGTALRSGHARDKSRNRALWLTHSPCRGLPMRRELPARVLPVLGGRGVTPESWWP